MISILLDHVRLVSLANSREHHAPRAKRAALQRGIAKLAMGPALHGHDVTGPLLVTITRVAPRELDSDNLAISAKSCRDGVAEALGVDDRDPRVTWVVRQEKGKPNAYAVRIEVARREMCPTCEQPRAAL